MGMPSGNPIRPFHRREVAIRADGLLLRGVLQLPSAARGLVVFAHGSGSGRLSPRNAFVADVLVEAGLATLLLDLLDPNEADDRSKVFDIELLADRLGAAADWAATDPETSGSTLGYFGASTGGGAALVAAARRPERVGAVVSRGGRPDLAGTYLERVTTPVLLIVGGADTEVLVLNRNALERLRGPRRLEVVPGASHLFPEPGALGEVARLAALWFNQYLN